MSMNIRDFGPAPVMEKTIVSKTLEPPASSMRLAVGAKAAILVVARGFSALVTEHSLALLAATKAALPRRRLTDLRVMYTADQTEADPDFLTFRDCHNWPAIGRTQSRFQNDHHGHERRELIRHRHSRPTLAS